MNRICKYLLSIGSAAAVLCGILTAMPVSAADDNTFTDKTLTYEKIDGGVRIISAEPGTIKLNIGKTIDGHAILEIGEKAFLGCSQLFQGPAKDRQGRVQRMHESAERQHPGYGHGDR